MASQSSSKPQLKEVQLDISKGPEGLCRMLNSDRNFHWEIQRVLQTAGIRGSLSIITTQTVEGTPHTKGLKIRSPQVRAAVLNWHNGSNNKNVEFLIPSDNSISLTERLRMAQTELKAADDRAERLRKAKSTGSSGSLENGTSADAQAASGGHVADNSNAETPEPSPQSEMKKPDIDDDTAELIVAEVAKVRTSEGLVPREQVLTALLAAGFAEGKRGPAMRSLMARGHFLESDRREVLYIGLRWWGTYGPPDVSPPKPAAKATGGEPDADGETSSPEQSLRGRVSRETRDKLGQLIGKAKLEESLIEQLSILDVEEAHMRERHANESKALDEKRAKIQAELEQPEIKGASQRWKKIQQELG